MTLVGKPVIRETGALYRRRPLVVTIQPRHLELREKGRRDTLSLDYLTIYEMAMKIRWRKQQVEKRKRP